MAAVSSCPSPTPPAPPRVTARAATSSTPSRAATSRGWRAARGAQATAPWATPVGASCWTSTTPTIPPAPTTCAGSARWRRARTGWRCPSAPASATTITERHEEGEGCLYLDPYVTGRLYGICGDAARWMFAHTELTDLDVRN